MSPLRILVFLPLIAGVSSSQTSDCSYLSLLNHFNLTTTNEVLAVMRPVKNWTLPTVVQMDMLLYGILQVDEKLQTVTSHIWIQVSWTNDFLTWNPSDFCGIEVLTIPISKLWIPDITIQEDASDTSSLRKGPLASVTSGGVVFATALQRLTSTCQLKLWLFPFDKQTCSITFSSMTYAEDIIELGKFSNDSTLTRISEQIMVTQGEWQLQSIETIITNNAKLGQNKLTYMVTIIRKPMLYVIILIVPLFYLLVLDLASFFISKASGEKLTFKVTILLSISVLLLILQDMLPSTEDNLPLMASYCIVIFALVGISVLEAMLVSFLTDLDDKCGKKAQRSAEAQVEIQLEANDHKDSAGAKGKDQVTPEKSSLPLVGPSGLDLLKLILEEVKAARQEAEGQEEDRRPCGFYTRVAEIIDSVFFVLYSLTASIYLTYTYIVWAQNYYN